MLLVMLSTASAVLPLPTYPQCGEEDREDLCPSELDASWWMISYIPIGSRDTIREAERTMGSGCAADRAWRSTTGRFDVLLAVADSGIDWGDDDYQNNVALNTAELPLPQLADGSTASDYDVDGNGLVNIQDYAQDPRVTISAGNDAGDAQLDASDLIYTFSDGVDDDGNGFMDDIAGWDFFGNDNDAYHSFAVDFGTHGSGVIEDIVSEGEGGGGHIGVCPSCSFVPLRIGDTFVSDGGRVAAAMIYATDRGAAAMSMATGSLSSPATLREAVAYAHAHDMVMVGAAGDENQYHANQPAALDDILFVHSIHSDTSDENFGAYSYFNTWNCNNYGPRMQLVAASSACATGSVAVTVGAAGLIVSAARDMGLQLSADEVYQLLIQTADDVNLTAEEQDYARAYPSGPGWDPFFGYGRVNVGRAVEHIVAGEIPPVANITGPAWLQVLDPASGKLPITGKVSARQGSYNWTLEVGYGGDPQTWTSLATGQGTTPFEGQFGELDLSTVPTAFVPEPDISETVVERYNRVMAPAVTVRLSVTDGAGQQGAFQKTFYVNEDDDRVAGFPIDLGTSGESSPVLADLDDDGIYEIILATSDGKIHAYHDDGTELPGFPIMAPASSQFNTQRGSDVGQLPDRFLGGVGIGDLDNDGSPEIVAASIEGKVYAWHNDGSMVTGFPVAIIGRLPEEFGPHNDWDNGFLSAPSLYDLDGDGNLEIIAAAMDQRLYVWDHTGADWGPYPIEVCDPAICDTDGARIINTPAIGDVDGDGAIDIGIGTNEAVDDGKASISYIYDATSGTLLPGWPLVEYGLVNTAGLLPIVGEGHPASLAFAELDGKAGLEVASPIMLGTSPLLTATGTQYLDISYVSSEFGAGTNTNQPSFVQMNTNPIFGDMTGDGTPDYVVGGTGALYLITLAAYTVGEFQHPVGAWDGVTGKALPGWPRQIEDLQFLVSPAMADISGDGQAETILGSAGSMLHAWDSDGNEPEGWPKFTGNWILGSPALGDIDGDGYLEVVVATREGWLWAWHTQGHADQHLQWASMHHDPQNTRNYETPIPTQAGPLEEAEDGCGCGRDDDKGEALLLLGVPLLFWRRRRGN